MEGGGDKGMGMLGSQVCFSGSSDCRWDKLLLLIATGAVCSTSGCQFSHIAAGAVTVLLPIAVWAGTLLWLQACAGFREK